MSERETKQEETPFPCHHHCDDLCVIILLPEIFVATMDAKVLIPNCLLHATEGFFVVMFLKGPRPFSSQEE